MKKTDYLIIGAGIAGLSAAYHLKNLGKVTVLTKGKLRQANTYWAQGGVAAVMAKDDRFKKHIDDTMNAGAHHNDRDAVRHLVESAPKAIRFLESIGLQFRPDPALEAGHSLPRVCRTSDFTGQDILNALIRTVEKEDSIQIVEDADAVELIISGGRCTGVFVRYDEETELDVYLAKNTILATGGLGQLYAKTSNTRAAGGDGLALAMKAGLELKDLEFVQFHPTALNIFDEGRYFLLSETLRGFGAKIVDHDGRTFLDQYDKRAELAPRDILSRAIFFELMNGPVYLDVRYFNPKEVKKNFPNISARLKKYGFDINKDLIPITPVAHFACGGVPTDIRGATGLPGLYALGEVACTGVHGANRLASNSLLEALVFSEMAAKEMEKNLAADKERVLDEKMILTHAKIVVEPIDQVKAYARRIGQIMWDKVGIIRSVDSLKEAQKEIAAIPARDYRIQNRQLVCQKLIEACLNRPQSLGCHYISPAIG